MPEQSLRLEQVMPLIRERLAAGEQVRFTPHGTSMLPMLLGGRDQVVLTALPKKLKKYDLPLYQRENGQYVLHRIVATGKTYTCVGDNQLALEHGVKSEQMIALVAGFTRNGKDHRVTDVGYRCYCRIWYWSRPLRWIYRGFRHIIRTFLHK